MKGIKRSTLLVGIVLSFILGTCVSNNKNFFISNDNLNFISLIKNSLTVQGVDAVSSNNTLKINTPNVLTTYSFSNDKLTKMNVERTKDEITTNTLNTYEYDDNGNLLKSVTSGQTIDVSYIKIDNTERKEISVNGISEMSTTQTISEDDCVKTFMRNYANGNAINCSISKTEGVIHSSIGDSYIIETDDYGNITLETNDTTGDKIIRTYGENDTVASQQYDDFSYKKVTNENNETVEYIEECGKIHEFQQLDSYVFSFDGRIIALNEGPNIDTLSLNGVNIDYIYEEQDQGESKTKLEEIKFADDKAFCYVNDDYGHIVSETNKFDYSSEEYEYDDYGQLLSWKKDDECQEYKYDDRGNLRHETNSNGTVYSYDVNDSSKNHSDELLSVNDKVILNDASHNIISFNGNTYAYKVENLMSSFENENSRCVYEYDVSGIRTWKKVNGSKTTYFYVNGLLLSERLPDGSYVTYLYDCSKSVLGFLCNDEMYCYLKDAKGCIRGILDKYANVLVSYSYDPWGKILKISDTSSLNLSVINHMLYKGYYYDEESGLYYIGHRYYNPEIRRFMSMDDLEYISQNGTNELYANLFAYAQNDPIMKGDLLGHEAITAVTICSALLIFSTVFLVFNINSLLNSFTSSLQSQLSSKQKTVLKNSSLSLKIFIGNLRDVLISLAISQLIRSWFSWLSGVKDNKTEVHHIIAQKDGRHQKPHDTLTITFGQSIHCKENLIPLKYRLHKHIHTNLYFITTNIMFQPYEDIQHEEEFFFVLAILKGLLMAVNTMN